MISATESAPAPERCCERESVRIGAERMVTVELETGGTLFLEVRAYCRSCRRVVAPRVTGRVSQTLVQHDAQSDAGVQQYAQSVGKSGTADALGLPPWDTLGELVSIPRIPRSELWEDYEKYRGREARRDRMRGLAGLNRGRTERVLEAVGALKPRVAISTIDHILDPNNPQRQDVDHLRYFPLISLTVNLGALEAWEIPISPQYPKQTFVFLAAYHIGTSIINHIVVMSGKSWIVTAYALSGPDRAIKERQGNLLYVGYAKKETTPTNG